jgi:hypothetical protein
MANASKCMQVLHVNNAVHAFLAQGLMLASKNSSDCISTSAVGSLFRQSPLVMSEQLLSYRTPSSWQQLQSMCHQAA